MRKVKFYRENHILQVAILLANNCAKLLLFTLKAVGYTRLHSVITPFCLSPFVHTVRTGRRRCQVKRQWNRSHFTALWRRWESEIPVSNCSFGWARSGKWDQHSAYACELHRWACSVKRNSASVVVIDLPSKKLLLLLLGLSAVAGIDRCC